MRQMLEAIKRSWCPETRAPGDYSPDVLDDPGGPAGQCAVTALLVQDLLGGDIVRGLLTRPSDLVGDGASAEFLNKTGSHYWNRIPDMGDVDLTLSQFPPWCRIYPGAEYPSDDGTYAEAPAVVPRSRLLEGERAIAARTPERYTILSLRFAQRYKSWKNPYSPPGTRSATAIVGRRLETGDVLEPTDVYASTSGNWEPCPVPGLTITSVTVEWIRRERP